jgi:hypothetical protein
LIVVMIASTRGRQITSLGDGADDARRRDGGARRLIALTAQIPIHIPFEQFYGDKVTLEEIATLNGRTNSGRRANR